MKINLTLLAILINISSILAQTGIGTTNVDPSSLLEVKSTKGGLLVSEFGQVLTADKFVPDPIAGSAGLMFYDTVVNNFFIHNGAKWLGQGGVPKGAIVMWNGTTPPSGWTLCNGNNGSPNLSGMFVKGWGDDAVGDKSGENFVTLQEANLPGHAHMAQGGEHTHTGTSGHTHPYTYTTLTITPFGTDPQRNNTSGGAIQVPRQTVTSEVVDLGPLSSTSSAASAITEVMMTGGGISHENRPPYYVLAFIMKL